MASGQVLQNYDLCEHCCALPGADGAAPYTELRGAEPRAVPDASSSVAAEVRTTPYCSLCLPWHAAAAAPRTLDAGELQTMAVKGILRSPPHRPMRTCHYISGFQVPGARVNKRRL
jgi:hypothetical protein